MALLGTGQVVVEGISEVCPSSVGERAIPQRPQASTGTRSVQRSFTEGMVSPRHERATDVCFHCEQAAQGGAARRPLFPEVALLLVYEMATQIAESEGLERLKAQEVGEAMVKWLTD